MSAERCARTLKPWASSRSLPSPVPAPRSRPGWARCRCSRWASAPSRLRPLLWGLAAGSHGCRFRRRAAGAGTRRGIGLPSPAGLLAGVLFLWPAGERSSAATSMSGSCTAPASAARCWCSASCFVHSLPGGLRDRHGVRFRAGGPRASSCCSRSRCRTCPKARLRRSRCRTPGSRPAQQFWAAVATSAPAAAGRRHRLPARRAVPRRCFPFSFAFAAGAMLALVTLELVPQAFTRRTWRMRAGRQLGGRQPSMLALSAAIGV